MYGVILKNLKVQQRNTDFLEIREILQLWDNFQISFLSVPSVGFPIFSGSRTLLIANRAFYFETPREFSRGSAISKLDTNSHMDSSLFDQEGPRGSAKKEKAHGCKGTRWCNGRGPLLPPATALLAPDRDKAIGITLFPQCLAPFYCTNPP